MKKTTLFLTGILGLLNFGNAQVIDDAVQGTGLNQHNYVGAGWVHGASVSVFHDGTLSYSNVTGDYVTLDFVGSEIVWYTEKKNTHGKAGVSIDGGAETFVDLYSSTEQHQVVYASSGLALGTHTIKIRVTGTKNPASSGYYVIHDAFEKYPPFSDGSLDTTSTFSGVGSGVGGTYGFPPFFYNTGFGFRTLENKNGSLNGNRNTAVGAHALVNSNGAYNTVVGFRALRDGHSASRNTAVGSFALNTYGSNNLPAIIHGDNNTAVGFNAGPGPFSGTFSNTTALGSGANVTASNQVRIGNTSVTSIGGKVSWSTLSDGRFKRDLREDVSGLEFINNLRPVSYMVDNDAIQKFLGIPDDVAFAAKEEPKRQTGFVAQEVDALVKKTGYVFSGVDAPKNDKDPYSIRYAEFVVPLVKAVQELSVKNEEQQKQIDQLLEQIKNDSTKDEELSEISLLQNIPNPFSRDTEIKMVLPESAGKATVIVYNLEGKQLRDLRVNGRGNTSVTILGGELSAGMYIYALIVDGKVIGTKRMILTK